MPNGTILVGEAGFPGETNKGVAIRRNLSLDVSKRLKEGITPFPEISKDDLEMATYYNLFSEDLMGDMWTIISEFCPGDVDQTRLSCERGSDTRIYYSDSCTVFLRARFNRMREGKTIWQLDIFVSIRC